MGGASFTFGVAYPIVYVFVAFLTSGVKHWVFDFFVPDCWDNDFKIKVPMAFEVVWFDFMVDCLELEFLWWFLVRVLCVVIGVPFVLEFVSRLGVENVHECFGMSGLTVPLIIAFRMSYERSVSSPGTSYVAALKKLLNVLLLNISIRVGRSLWRLF